MTGFVVLLLHKESAAGTTWRSRMAKRHRLPRSRDSSTDFRPAAAMLVATALLGAPEPVGASANLKALGRQLAQECTPCHRLDGADAGIPSIVGLEPDYLIETMSLYKNGQRNNPAMVSVAQSLDERQIRALALYLGALPKPESQAGTDKKSQKR
jgi:cytochrome c553